jgi:hypothetical protein
VAIVIATSLAGFPTPAAAQQDKPSAGALERFDAAQKLFDQGKREEALALFQEVYDETKSPNARLMAARCLVALGRTAEGYDELYATMREAASKAQTEPKYGKTRDAAAAEIGILEPKVGKIVVALVDPDAKVTLNGQKLPPGRLGVPLATMPGTLQLVATRRDGATVRREETIAAGETKTVTLVFPSSPVTTGEPPAPPAPPAATPPVEPPPVEDLPPVKTGGGVRVAGFVVAGLGAVGMGVFGATYAVAQGKYDSLKANCGTMRCTDPKYADVIDTGKRMELVSNVSVAVGGAALGVGLAMIVFGGPKTQPPSKTGAWPSTSVVVSPYGTQLRIVSAF